MAGAPQTTDYELVEVEFERITAHEVLCNKRLRAHGDRSVALQDCPVCPRCKHEMAAVDFLDDECSMCGAPKPFLYMKELAFDLPWSAGIWRIKRMKRR